MKMQIKPIVLDVIEDDGMWLDQSTMTYYDKDALEPILEPHGLDEAAEIDFMGRMDEHISGMDFHKPDMISSFKSGAKWMAKQGLVEEKTVGRTPFNGPNGVEVFLDSSDGFQLGDKVIVQIRKK